MPSSSFLSFKHQLSLTDMFCKEEAVVVPNNVSYDTATYPSSPRSECSDISQNAFHPFSRPSSIHEVNHRIAEWAATTKSALAVSTETSLIPPSPPSSFKHHSSSLSSFSSPTSTEYHDGIEFLHESPTASRCSPPISDVLAYGLEDISVFEQKWDNCFNLSKSAPGMDSIKEVFAITTKAQEALLLQTAFLEVHLGQDLLKIQSMVEDLTRRRKLLANTFHASNCVEAWVSMRPELDMFHIEGEYVCNHVVFAECRALVRQTDEFIIRHIPARCIAAKFLRDPATILKSDKQ